MARRRIAVTGAGGRLGSALMNSLRGADAIAWSRPEYDVDVPGAADRLLDRDRLSHVIHCAAWTDVDGCALNPDLAMRRNAIAVAELASACASRGVGLVLISTNEVFDGERREGRGYTEADPPGPINPYGASKLAGEREASDAYEGHAHLWIVRTAWLFGPPGNDFPNKILAAADRLPTGEPLSVVDDEIGSPTFAPDLAEGLLNLIELTDGGEFHLVNDGRASRLDWSARVLGRLRPDRPLRPISRTAFSRPSEPPAWAVLDSIAVPDQARLRHWTDATDAYLADLAG